MRMHNAAYFYSITSNSISCLNSWEDIQFGVSCGVAVKVWSRQQFFQVIYDTPFHITCLPFVSFLHWFCPFCIVFEVFHYKADTCANNPAPSLIVMCPRLQCQHSCQFILSWVCYAHCLCFVCVHMYTDCKCTIFSWSAGQPVCTDSTDVARTTARNWRPDQSHHRKFGTHRLTHTQRCL